MTAYETDLLADFMDRKQGCLRALRDLGRQQETLIEGGDITQLLRVLAVKQRLIDQLQELEQGLEPFRHQKPDERRWRSSLDRERCAGVAQQCEALLAEIIANERQSEVELRARRNLVADQLNASGQVYHAHCAYLGAPNALPTSLDIASEG